MDLSGRVVGIAGKRAASAFGLRRVEWLEPVELGRGERLAVVFPHPSGVVLWWNDPRNVAAASRCLRRLLRAAEGRG